MKTIKRKKIAVIGTVGLPANYGGFETLTEHLVTQLSDGYDFTVYCSAKKYPAKERLAQYKGARLRYLPFNANGIQSILYDTLSLLHAMFFADVLLVLGVSGCFLLPFVRLFTRAKIITSIDGIEWKRAKWSKPARLFLWGAEWMAVKFSHANIADNESIQDYTAIRYRQLSNIIEYGADHTMTVQPEPADIRKYPFIQRPYAFKVCRIEPENNIEMVLEAFSRLPQHTFVLVGNWKHSPFSILMRETYSKFRNLILLDPIYDQRELDVLRSNSLLYIHGHSAGGTNPSLVEAMYLGLPVMTFHVAYNRTTTEGKALYFGTADELIAHIRNHSVMQLKQLGREMKEIAYRRYTWKVVANKYAYLVEAVLANRLAVNLSGTIGSTLSQDSLLDYELAHLQNAEYFYEKR